MDLKTNRAQDQKCWRTVGNQDSTVKGHIYKLTPFEFQSRASKLKYSRPFSQTAKTAPTHHLKPVPCSGLRLPLDQGGNTWQAPGEARGGIWLQIHPPRQWTSVYPGRSCELHQAVAPASLAKAVVPGPPWQKPQPRPTLTPVLLSQPLGTDSLICLYKRTHFQDWEK